MLANVNSRRKRFKPVDFMLAHRQRQAADAKAREPREPREPLTSDQILAQFRKSGIRIRDKRKQITAAAE